MHSLTDAVASLRQHFGFEDFREGQREVIGSILAGKDAVVVMPTGSGKSLCYQLPALILDGVTLVVSPLIALMKDQVDALRARGLPATFINSSISETEQRERIDALRRGEHKLVYIAPERFRSGRFNSALQQIPISLFAVDEAHCISTWGHDFRPDYLRLRGVIRSLGTVQTLALGNRTTRTHRRAAPWRTQTRLHRARTFSQRPFQFGFATDSHLTLRRRRSALHLDLGSRLSSRLPASARRYSLARNRANTRSHCDRDALRPLRHP